MTAILNIFFAVLLFGTGIYHIFWTGSWTDALTMFVLISILHNAAGGYKAAENTVVIYRLLQTIDKRTKYVRNRLFTEQER